MNFRPRPGEALRVQKPEKSKRFGPAVSLPQMKRSPLTNRSDSARAIHTPNEALRPAKAFSTKRFASRETQCSRTKRSPFFTLARWRAPTYPFQNEALQPDRRDFPRAKRFVLERQKKPKRFGARAQKGERFDNPAAGRAWSRRAGFRPRPGGSASLWKDRKRFRLKGFFGTKRFDISTQKEALRSQPMDFRPQPRGSASFSKARKIEALRPAPPRRRGKHSPVKT